MTIFAFMAAPALEAQTKTETLPTFKPRWWHRAGRLDIRPVIWSLRNHPEEWRSDHRYTITHVPSQHEFWIANGWGFYSLYHSGGRGGDECSCERWGGHFQRFQQGSFGRAYRRWRRWAATSPEHRAVASQFAAHFIRPTP